MIQSLWRTVWRCLKKLGIKLPYDPTIPLLGIHPEETIFNVLFWPSHMACRILPGMGQASPVLEARSLNHHAAREVPACGT